MKAAVTIIEAMAFCIVIGVVALSSAALLIHTIDVNTYKWSN